MAEFESYRERIAGRNASVEWGKEIEVDGNFPDWLKKTDIISVRMNRISNYDHIDWYAPQLAGAWSKKDWATIRVIRLEAGHPRYDAKKTDSTLYELLDALKAHSSDGTMATFEHSSEEIGILVMDNYLEVIAAIEMSYDPALLMRSAIAKPSTEQARAEEDERLENRGAKLLIAYHVAICSPKGVVPDDDFYDPAMAADIHRMIDAGLPLKASTPSGAVALGDRL